MIDTRQQIIFFKKPELWKRETNVVEHESGQFPYAHLILITAKDLSTFFEFTLLVPPQAIGVKIQS